jgi:N-methylhydantoinase A
MYKVGIDTGGTHTDVILANVETGEAFSTKVSTTPDLVEGVSTGISQILSIAGCPPEDIRELIYGTTIVVNMIAQRQLGHTALITTKGFRDVLEIGRAFREKNIYDIQMEKPECLIHRHLRYEVTERIDFCGRVLIHLDLDEVRHVVQEMKEKGVRAVAVCFLHAYINPTHEQAVRKIVEQEYPQVYVSLSSEVNPQFREYERVSTTAINAAMMPNMVSHLGEFKTEIIKKRISAACYVMQANAGVASFDAFVSRPVFAANSGPIAGIISSNELAKELGIPNLITFDMGGTSTDVCLVQSNTIKFSTDNKVEGYPISIPAVELSFIGAGGGSVAWIDPGGALKVGPMSQGAYPGPVCYRRGGTKPTVTDANLIVGIIRPEMFLHNLEEAANLSRQAVREKIADALKLDLLEASEGILQVVNSNMIRAIRNVSVEKGYDPREFVLIAFGGAGPIHAGRLAEELEIPTVVVPFSPGTFSALGLLMADVKYDFVHTTLLEEDRVTAGRLNEIFAEMASRGSRILEEEHVMPEDRVLISSCDIRYYGQSFELNVPVPSGQLNDSEIGRIRERFHETHRRIYGHAMPEPLEFVNYRVSALGKLRKFRFREKQAWDTQPKQLKDRSARVIFDGKSYEVPVYERTHIEADFQITGPAVICEMGATTVVYPGQTAHVDHLKNILIRTRSGQHKG